MIFPITITIARRNPSVRLSWDDIAIDFNSSRFKIKKIQQYQFPDKGEIKIAILIQNPAKQFIY